MKLSRIDLERIAGETGFQAEPLEKVLHLLDLLESLRSHPYLIDRLALKGGTAVNLFMLDAPRLSAVLPLEARKIEFVSLVNDRGEIAPSLLTDDPDLRDRIRSHPALLWKTLNLRKRAGLSIGAGTSADSGAGGDTDRWR